MIHAKEARARAINAATVQSINDSITRAADRGELCIVYNLYNLNGLEKVLLRDDLEKLGYKITRLPKSLLDDSDLIKIEW